ncbi:MAG: hypothetical protein H6625_05730 [Bdellovibrionaceae bacterium]|nr:hypothetical protein [Pseudobdellovibrionaceae bacterium]
MEPHGFLKNIKAFSAVEAVVVLGLMSAITLTTGQIMVLIDKENAASAHDLVKSSIVSEIQMTLVSRDNCVSTLTGKNPVAGDTIDNIIETAPTPTVTYTSGKSYGFGRGKAKIHEIRFHKFERSSDDSNNKKRGHALISIEFDNDEDITNNNDGRRRIENIAITVRLGGANNVESCVANTADSNLLAACNSLGGTLISLGPSLRCANLHTNGTTVVNSSVGVATDISGINLNILNSPAPASPQPLVLSAPSIMAINSSTIATTINSTNTYASGLIHTVDGSYTIPVANLYTTDGHICSSQVGYNCMRVGLAPNGICSGTKAITSIDAGGDNITCLP